MDEDGIRRMCAEAGLAPRTAHTITDVETMLDNLAVAGRLGFAVDDEEASEGVICVGAAFFGHDGACAGAVSVTGIKGDLPAGRIGELGRAVRSCADDVSGILQGSPFASPALAAQD
jgi:IclR family transcriptional regulator, acetate operon repressor